jgi:hypothetical protein
MAKKPAAKADPKATKAVTKMLNEIKRPGAKVTIGKAPAGKKR